MVISREFDRYMAHLAEGLGHADRHAGLMGYGTGLMLPLSRKSVEPMAVSVSLACEPGSLPVAWRLYLPRNWAEDAERRRKAGVPQDIGFATKPHIALQQLQGLLSEGAPRHRVLADAGYGSDSAFRQGLTDLGLPYVLGITSAVVVWPPGVEHLPPKPCSGMGRPPVMPRRTTRRQPVSVKALAQSLPASVFQSIGWREGTNGSPARAAARARLDQNAAPSGEHRIRSRPGTLPALRLG